MLSIHHSYLTLRYEQIMGALPTPNRKCNTGGNRQVSIVYLDRYRTAKSSRHAWMKAGNHLPAQCPCMKRGSMGYLQALALQIKKRSNFLE